ncbi:MAG: HPr family phosphocarrier protein [Pseudomonadota bacterium]
MRAALTIINEKGLHARASARFAAVVEEFDAEVTVTRDGMTVNGGSIMGLLMLAAARGSTVHVTAQGPQASEALGALEALIGDRFGEPT